MPASSRVFIGPYDFDLAIPGKNAPIRGRRRFPHIISEPAIGPSGPITFTMQDWSQGQQTVEEGIEYHQKPKYISSKGADAAFPGQIICQPQATTISVGSGPALGSILKQIDFTASGGAINTFIIQNQRYQHKLSGANTWTQAVDLGSGQVAKDGIAHGGNIAIGYGSGGQVFSADGVTFTVATANKADAYGALGTNLYRAVVPNTVFASTAVNGAWDSGSTIADSSFSINSLTGIEQVLMIGKQDGVYSIDSDGVVVPFTPELRTQANANFASVRAADAFNGDFYFRTLNGVIKIAAGDGSKSRVGLDQLASPDFPTVVVQAITHDDRFLYALCANVSNDLMILRRSIQGNWHVFYWDGSIGTKQGQHIAVSSVFGYPALFFSYYDGSSAYTTKFIRLSTFPNPLQDTNYRFDTSTTGRIRIGRFGTAEAQMVIDQMTIQTRQCATGVTVTPYYSADGGAITRFESSSKGVVTGSPYTTILASAPISANYVDIYFDLATNSATTTPVLVGFSMKGAFRPNHRRVHSFNFVTTRGHGGTRTGNRLTAPTETAQNIEALLASTTYQTVIDERGATFQGLVHDISRLTLDVDPGDEPDEFIQVTVWEASAVPLPGAYGLSVYGLAVYG